MANQNYEVAAIGKWQWNSDSQEIIETSGCSEMVVGYAPTKTEAEEQMRTFQENES